ncbi:unnamed protein product [Ilex paraguariensis]|uniref:Uncharacterized protein n=1 Tax=Ilex paraguariensis TaxID=185542 RepID=A0ABC8U3V8_9AQUA
MHNSLRIHILPPQAHSHCPQQPPGNHATGLNPLPRPFLFHVFSANSRSSQPSQSQPLQCSSQQEAQGEKFLRYAPHSGFSNQLSEFKNILIGAAQCCDEETL